MFKTIEYESLLTDINSFQKSIFEVIKQMKRILNTFDKCHLNEKNFNIMFENIRKIIVWWTGNTYVGYKKNSLIKKLFQQFYELLYEILIKMKSSGFKQLSDFTNNALYQGKIYRYIGYNENNCKKEPKQINYNNIYVSWSKLPENSYFEQKLCGTITHISCEISGDYYGIDLSAFEASRANEEEVVFPTVKSLITEIRIIEEDDDEGESEEKENANENS